MRGDRKYRVCQLVLTPLEFIPISNNAECPTAYSPLKRIQHMNFFPNLDYHKNKPLNTMQSHK